MSTPLEYMHHAYELALRGWGRVSPNPMVGAVLVKSDKVIAEGWHPYCGGPHAEAMAIELAGRKAAGADLYVTLEPCSHFGRTPPCTDAIIRAGIKRVYVGVLDPNRLMNGKSVKLLRKKGIAVEVGFLEQELTHLNAAFVKHMTTGLPLVTAKIAQTLDGKIATTSGESKWITGEEARAYSRQRRFGFDAMLVGINTVLMDDPLLTSQPQKRHKKIILDGRLRLPAKAKLFKGTKPEDVIVFTASASTKSLPATIVRAPAKHGKIDLRWVFKYLGRQGVNDVLIEGGAQVIGNALACGLVDKMMIYLAPKIMGEGLSAVLGIHAQGLNNLVRLQDIQMVKQGEDMVLEGCCVYGGKH